MDTGSFSTPSPSRWNKSMLLVIVGSSLWITDLIDLMTGISHMRLIHALTCGMIVFVMPFIVWKNLPFALAGWKTRKSS